MVDADYRGYVRTTDEDNPIIDLANTPLPFQIVDGIVDFNSQGRYKIVSQADTIEELCDEFVCGSEAYKDGKPFVLRHYDLKERIKFYHKVMKCSIYGAIWTNKGLIYVAKMDDEGRLTLIVDGKGEVVNARFR